MELHHNIAYGILPRVLGNINDILGIIFVLFWDIETIGSSLSRVSNTSLMKRILYLLYAQGPFAYLIDITPFKMACLKRWSCFQQRSTTSFYPVVAVVLIRRQSLDDSIACYHASINGKVAAYHIRPHCRVLLG
jgi:hypothetical protein